MAAAGDFVNIRPGIYRETVVPANSGAPGQPVTFQPDGDAEVTVSGADLVDGDWTVYSGQIDQRAIALPLTGYGEQITGNETLLANQAVRLMMAALMDRSANRCWRGASHQTRFNPYASH